MKVADLIAMLQAFYPALEVIVPVYTYTQAFAVFRGEIDVIKRGQSSLDLCVWLAENQHVVTRKK